MYLNKFLKFFQRRKLKFIFNLFPFPYTFLLEKHSDINFLIEQIPNKLLYKLVEVNLLVICGNDILKSEKEKYKIIFNDLLLENENCSFIGFTNNSLIAAVLPDSSELIANQIHKQLFE